MPQTADYLIGAADRVSRIARTIRDLCDELESASDELLAKAVELDTIRDRANRCSGGADETPGS